LTRAAVGNEVVSHGQSIHLYSDGHASFGGMPHLWVEFLALATARATPKRLAHRCSKTWLVLGDSQVLAFAFLLQGFHPDRQSAEPQPLAWQFANWITVSTWLFALLTVVLAKKAPIRRSLLVWGLITPLAAWIVVMMGFGLGGDKNYDTREFVQHSLAAYRIEILRIGRNG
jgi:hypothetical protein